MGFQTRILLALVAVGLLPALLLSVLSFRANREELLLTVGWAQRQVAEEAARYAGQSMIQSVEGLRLAVEYIPFQQLSREELTRVLSIPFRQLPTLGAVAVLDDKGEAVVPPLVRVERPSEELNAFASRIPFERAVRDGLAVGAPYPGGSGASRIPVAVRIGKESAGEGAPRVVAAEVSLDELSGHLADLAADGRYAALIGPDGVVALEAGAAGNRGTAERALVAASLSSREPAVRALEREDGTEWLTAVAPVPELGWAVLVSRPGSEAFRAANRVLHYTVYWAAVALVLTVVLGVVLARGMSRPLGALTRAADALGRGELDHRPDVTSTGEVGVLAGAFNLMADEIARRDREIRQWNEELQRRVEQKTRELREALDQVERSRRLAGLASLGAGMAHELNNPLTTITGLVTLVKDDLGKSSPHYQALNLVLGDADRIASIVGTFRKLAEQEGGERSNLNLSRALDNILTELGPEMERQNVRVRREVAVEVPEVVGDSRELEEALRHVARNALQAMPSGGELAAQLRPTDQGAVKLTVSDTGVG
ncbi:MAG TPA: HAMP domain-containing protein, partial [Myxococcaceae bacterium]|nr:HAMP domain-containing protein [Myxococcaceae bacterium]